MPLKGGGKPTGADGSGGARDTHYLGQGDTLDPAFILEMKAWMMFNVTFNSDRPFRMLTCRAFSP